MSFFNPLHHLWPYPQARILRVNFRQKVVDTFGIFAGSLNERAKNDHLGLFDYLTLFIPFLLSKGLSKGIENTNRRPFLIHWGLRFMRGVLTAFRYLAAAIFTFTALPFIASVHLFTFIKTWQLKKEIQRISGQDDDQKPTTLGECLENKKLTLEDVKCRYIGNYINYKLAFYERSGDKPIIFSTRANRREQMNAFSSVDRKSCSDEQMGSLIKLNVGNLRHKFKKINFDVRCFYSPTQYKETNCQSNRAAVDTADRNSLLIYDT